ncbi:MAG: hypothetical protein ACNS61_07645, partial [Candidatus Wenzhouxiangella sp. M2_3B_020]
RGEVAAPTKVKQNSNALLWEARLRADGTGRPNQTDPEQANNQIQSPKLARPQAAGLPGSRS